MNDLFNKKIIQSYKHNASIVRILGACIVLCLVFVGGFMVRGNTDLLGALGFDGLVSNAADSRESNGDSGDDLSSRIAEVDDIVSDESTYEYGLDSMTSEVLRAYASDLKDPFMRYYDAASYQKYLASTAQADQGVGVLFFENEGKVMVADVLESSKAAAEGVESGDYVIGIDGDERDNWSLPEVLAALNRDEGDSVYLKLGRQDDSGSASSYEVTLTYRQTKSVNVTHSLENRVAYIDLNQISSDSASVVKSAVKESLDKGATSFVLDLRDVPGGYLTQAVSIASLFMDGGTVVQVKTKDATTSKNAEGTRLTNAPLVVLVDKQTAGSAEVLAAALQESGRAQLVGATTQGKGTIQVMKQLSFGGALRYTVATYLTAKGRSFDGAGITPDIAQKGAGKQKQRALELARSEAS